MISTMTTEVVSVEHLEFAAGVTEVVPTDAAVLAGDPGAPADGAPRPALGPSWSLGECGV